MIKCQSYTQNIFGNMIPIIKYIYFIKNSKRNLYHRNKLQFGLISNIPIAN